MTHNRDSGIHSECLSAYALDRANLFPVAGAAAKHLEQCAACRDRQQALRAAALQFESQMFPRTAAAVIERVLEDQSHFPPSVHEAGGRRYRRILGSCIAAAAAAVFMLSVFPLKPKPPQPVVSHGEKATTPYLGDKGAAGLEVYCKRGNLVFRVHEGMTLFAEDRIRFVPVLSKDDPRYLMVVSVDNTGTVSRYFPQDSEEAGRVDTGKTPLPGSTILDDTAGPERLWLLSSKVPFHFEAVRSAISEQWQQLHGPERMGNLPLPMDQTSLVFWKGETP